VPGGPSTTAEWTIALDLPAYAAIEAEVVAFLHDHGVDASAVFASQLVVEETVRNLIEHTGADPAVDTATIRLQVEPEAVIVRIEDGRPPFDPFDAPRLDAGAPLEERRAGGMGLHLVRELTDALSYERIGDRNRLTATVART